MKKDLKKLMLILLACMMLHVMSLPISATSENEQIAPCYINANSYTDEFIITDSGIAVVMVTYQGLPSAFTKADISVKIQKKFLFLFWNDVDIGYPNNEWTDECTDLNGTFYNTFAVNGTGTYRALITVNIYGHTSGYDTIELIREYKYQ